MGRFYYGDIDGKFWFSVQASDDASFFGGDESEPQLIEYNFDSEEHLAGVQEGIETCEAELGKFKAILDDFFAENQSYNDEQISKKYGIQKETVATLLRWYARLELGRKIEDSLLQNGSCFFEAEL